MLCKIGHGLGRFALLARPSCQTRHVKRIGISASGKCTSSVDYWFPSKGSGQRQGTLAPSLRLGAIRREWRGLSSTPVVSVAAVDDERPQKSACKSWSYLAEIVGNQQLAGRGIRTSAGEILKLIDLSASFAAALHSNNPNTTTLAFDHVELTVPILHGDMSVSHPERIRSDAAPPCCALPIAGTLAGKSHSCLPSLSVGFTWTRGWRTSGTRAWSCR